jgi:hypothetical protein
MSETKFRTHTELLLFSVSLLLQLLIHGPLNAHAFETLGYVPALLPCVSYFQMQHTTAGRNTTHHLEHACALRGPYISNLSNDTEDSSFLIHNF